MHMHMHTHFTTRAKGPPVASGEVGEAMDTSAMEGTGGGAPDMSDAAAAAAAACAEALACGLPLRLEASAHRASGMM
jgi:hypothetical protein